MRLLPSGHSEAHYIIMSIPRSMRNDGENDIDVAKRLVEGAFEDLKRGGVEVDKLDVEPVDFEYYELENGKVMACVTESWDACSIAYKIREILGSDVEELHGSEIDLAKITIKSELSLYELLVVAGGDDLKLATELAKYIRIHPEIFNKIELDPVYIVMEKPLFKPELLFEARLDKLSMFTVEVEYVYTGDRYIYPE